MEKIKVKVVGEEKKIPQYATSGSAAVDLRADIEADLVIKAGKRELVPTGIRMEIPLGVVGLIFARSGLAIKHGIQLSNSVGVIDSDYRGEIKVGLYNSSDEDFVIKPEDRIAQMAFMPYYFAEFVSTDSLTDTERGEGGFGSTGKE